MSIIKECSEILQKEYENSKELVRMAKGLSPTGKYDKSIYND